MTGIRQARIDTVPGLKEAVARAYAENATQEEIAEVAGVRDRGTVATWLKREDVQMLVSKFVQERQNKILRSTDTRIEKVLQSEKELSLERLLKIRQTFAPNVVKVDLSGDQAGIVEEFLRQMHDDPEAAAKAAAALQRSDDTD
jgi:transcriptional regulator with XRE-family HTH domain